MYSIYMDGRSDGCFFTERPIGIEHRRRWSNGRTEHDCQSNRDDLVLNERRLSTSCHYDKKTPLRPGQNCSVLASSSNRVGSGTRPYKLGKFPERQRNGGW